MKQKDLTKFSLPLDLIQIKDEEAAMLKGGSTDASGGVENYGVGCGCGSGCGCGCGDDGNFGFIGNDGGDKVGEIQL